MESASATPLELPAGIRGVLLRVVSPFRSVARSVRSRAADPRATLEAYLEAEFQGSEDAYGLITLSPFKRIEIMNRFPGSALTLLDMVSGSYSCDPVMAVRSYRILSMTQDGRAAQADVEYEVAGSFNRVNNSVCAYQFTVPVLRILQERLTLRLVEGGQETQWYRGPAWRIEDPPAPPKVSISALLRLCRKKRDSFQAIAKRTGQRGEPIQTTIAAVLATYEEKVHTLQKLELP